MKKGRLKLLIVILVILNVVSLLYAVTLGSVDMSIKDVYSIILYKIFGYGNLEGISPARIDIVYLVRLPRLLLACISGVGLSLCGIIMQSIVRNPLADPYILGVSSGATLGATFAVLLGVGTIFGSNYIGIMAFLSALGVSFLVILLSNIGGRADSVKLLLSGMAISVLCQSLSGFFIYVSDDRDALKNISFWMMGSFSGAKYPQIKILAVITLAVFIFFILQSRILNLMLLGDETAVTLGYDLNSYRHLYLVLVSLLTGFMIYNTGIIGFVGLIIPHFTRMITGTDHKKVIVLAATLGSLLLLWADVLSRFIVKGAELPVGIIVSTIGAPLFIFLMVKNSFKRKGGAR